jgi:hypothetical protein
MWKNEIEIGRENTMKRNMMTALVLVTAVVILTGCDSGGQVKTGFLSDYSKLQRETDSSLRYVDNGALARYSGFIVDPVTVRLYAGAKSAGKLTTEQITDLTGYLHAKILEAVQGAGKKVAYKPAAGVARIRVALTDIEKTSAINILPQASLLNAGIGGATMEAELVDSMTGKQIGAVMESGKGSRVPFSNLGDWTAAKGVMDGWAARFQKRLEENR